ncbi:DUF4952 domain-containing protein [Oxalobacter sp. OttesenSCG-928-P03]|nr:DUF4952 domain-containing protein [Oxalobacter sp. OttesenSCG-928-P03]
MKLHSFFITAFLFLAMTSGSYVSAEPACGDFLAMAGKKPAMLQYLGCSPGKSAQLHVLRARYRVAGRDAHAVEAFLVKETGMLPLSRVCCIWETLPKEGKRYGHIPHNQWPEGSSEAQDPMLANYKVDMGSGENLVSQRERWEAIDWFYVTVDLFLDAP